MRDADPRRLDCGRVLCYKGAVFGNASVRRNFSLSRVATKGCNALGMRIRKIAAATILVFSSFAATNVAPSKSELEAMYSKAFRDFDTGNFPQALKELDDIDARQPDLAESQNLRGVILIDRKSVV